MTAHAPKVWNRRQRNVPQGAVYVGRPTKWGNPYSLRNHTRREALRKYRDWLEDQITFRHLDPRELRGRDLICWCAPDPCHADILLCMANPKGAPQEQDPSPAELRIALSNREDLTQFRTR